MELASIVAVLVAICAVVAFVTGPKEYRLFIATALGAIAFVMVAALVLVATTA